jgi:hypothetical protein
MLQTKTCFVLGAGASQAYGFPSGGELAEELANITEPGDSTRQTTFRQRLVGLMSSRELTAASEAKVFEFSNLLRRSNLGSIDLFLNFHRKDDAALLIGKAGIGFLLGEREEPDRTRSHCKVQHDTDHWLGFLWGALTTGASDPTEVLKNPVSFVTFNYDRSLEFLLTDFAKASFGWNDAQCEAMLDAWPITHVYGDLGAYPRHGKGGSYVTYSEGAAFHHMEAAVDRIRTIHEVTQAATKEDSDRSAAARKQIASSNRIIFLGCAYHEENINLLGLHRRTEGPQCFLSRFGLSGVQANRAVQFIGENTSTSPNERHKSREYLRNSIDL